MPISATCPKCQRKYNLADQFLGKSVKCQTCGTAFKVQSAKPGTTGQPAVASVGAGGVLESLGLDGPIIRPGTDIFATPNRPIGAPDPVGLHPEFDPGFATAIVSNQNGNQTSAKSNRAGAAATASTQTSAFNNPYAASAVAMKKSSTQKLSEVQEKADRIMNLAEAHNGMLVAFAGAFGCNVIFSILIGAILYFSGYTIAPDKTNLGLSFEIYVTILIISGVATVAGIAIGVMFLKDLYRTAKISQGSSSMAIVHLLLQFVPILGLISILIVDRGARNELKAAGFPVGLLGVPRSKLAIGVQSQPQIIRKTSAWAEETSRLLRSMLKWFGGSILVALITFGMIVAINFAESFDTSVVNNSEEFQLSLNYIVCLFVLGIGNLAVFATQLMCLLSIASLAERLKPGQNQGFFHVVLFFLPLGQLYSLISLSKEGRKQLVEAGFKVSSSGRLI